MPHPPFITLDEKSDAPLYRQIYEIVRRSILGGELRSGSLLPASRHLAKQLGVSRTTVTAAYDQLLAEGYLESRAGAGTFVAASLPEEFLQTPGSETRNDETKIEPRRLKLSRYGKNALEETAAIVAPNQISSIVPFQHGLGAIDKFPFGIWAKLTSKCYDALRRYEFGYGDAAGFYPLREAIAAYLKSFRAVNCVPQQVIITNGAQHAFDLISKIFLEPGAKVLIEDPGYTSVKQAFQCSEAKFVPVPIDKNGFNLSAIKQSEENARLVYVTPSHQFPLGVTMSLARRLQLLEWAHRRESWIVEDDYDSEFRYAGRPLASLQGLDQHHRVFYVGTFSKTIFPALRLGCLVVPPDLIDVFTAVRALGGLQSPLIEQATLAEFINAGHYTRHLRQMRKLYQERQNILISEVKKHLAGRLEVHRSVAGMHLIGWLPDGVNDYAVAEKAMRFGIKTFPISSYWLNRKRQQRGGLILGYTAVNEEQIKKGIKQLAAAMTNLDRR